jgi:hypothetical protein
MSDDDLLGRKVQAKGKTGGIVRVYDVIGLKDTRRVFFPGPASPRALKSNHPRLDLLARPIFTLIRGCRWNRASARTGALVLRL